MGASLKPCGTVAAYRRHLYLNEPPCEDCRQANNDYERARRHALGYKPYKMSECGTDAGHARHYYTGTVPCQSCKEAHAAAKRNRRTDLNLRRRRGSIGDVAVDYLETHGPMSMTELHYLIGLRHTDITLDGLRKAVNVLKGKGVVEMRTEWSNGTEGSWTRGIYSTT